MSVQTMTRKQWIDQGCPWCPACRGHHIVTESFTLNRADETIHGLHRCTTCGTTVEIVMKVLTVTFYQGRDQKEAS